MSVKLDVTPDHVWEELGQRLRESGYDSGWVRAALGLADSVEDILSSAGFYSFVYFERIARRADPVSVLARLFLFCGRVPVAELELLDPRLSSLLGQVGALDRVAEDPGLVRSSVSIVEYRGRYFISDTLFENHCPGFSVHLDESRCMPLHASSLELFSALRRPDDSRSFLDVGCGSGCQSILFASSYERIVGFDPNPRAVDFSRVNALLNGVSAYYTMDGWESFTRSERYDHVVYNSPDSGAAFSFINDGLDGLLTGSGCAQIWLSHEVTGAERDWTGALRANIAEPDRWWVGGLVNEGSRFSVSRECVSERRLPRGSLLVGDASESAKFFEGLAERGVVEVVSVTLTIRRSAVGGV